MYSSILILIFIGKSKYIKWLNESQWTEWLKKKWQAEPLSVLISQSLNENSVVERWKGKQRGRSIHRSEHRPMMIGVMLKIRKESQQKFESQHSLWQDLRLPHPPPPETHFGGLVSLSEDFKIFDFSKIYPLIRYVRSMEGYGSIATTLELIKIQSKIRSFHWFFSRNLSEFDATIAEFSHQFESLNMIFTHSWFYMDNVTINV